MTPAIVIPWRGGSSERERNLRFVEDWYRDLGLPIFMADHDPSLSFNRGGSRNAAIAAAEGYDPLIVIDGDCVADLRVVLQAIDVARETGKLVLPHDDFWRLSEKGTQRLLANPTYFKQTPGDVLDLIGEPRLGKSVMPSGALVISRESFERVGGYESRLLAWGYEDSLFLQDCRETVGVERLPGFLWHLHHKRETGTIADREAARVIAEQHLAERRAGK